MERPGSCPEVHPRWKEHEGAVHTQFQLSLENYKVGRQSHGSRMPNRYTGGTSPDTCRSHFTHIHTTHHAHMHMHLSQKKNKQKKKDTACFSKGRGSWVSLLTSQSNGQLGGKPGQKHPGYTGQGIVYVHVFQSTDKPGLTKTG